MRLNIYLEQLLSEGPDKVYWNGKILKPLRKRLRECSFILVRRDWFSLACRKEDLCEAHGTNPSEWVGVVICVDSLRSVWMSIEMFEVANGAIGLGPL